MLTIEINVPARGERSQGDIQRIDTERYLAIATELLRHHCYRRQVHP
jgi:hypothetical protein